MIGLKLLLLLFLGDLAEINCAVTDGGTPGLPGVKLHLTAKGMRYLSSVAGQVLNDRIQRNTEIPKVSVNFKNWIGDGTLSGDRIRIDQFRPPSYLYENRPPDRFVWKTNGGFVKVTGQWLASYRTPGWFLSASISKDGNFEAETQEIPQFGISARFSNTWDGKLEARDIECHANLGRLSLSISGGFPGALLNFFRGVIESAIRPAVEAELCRLGKQYVETVVNSKIRQHTFLHEIWPNLVADYRLTRGFLMTPNSVESWHRGSALFKRQPRMGVPFYPHPLQGSGSDSKMLYIRASDYFFNSVLYQAHRFNISRFVDLERITIDSKIGQYLRPVCPRTQVCLGTIFPEIESLFPNAKGHLEARTTEVPTILFQNGNARAKGRGYLELFAVQGNNKTRILGFLGSLEANLHFSVANPDRADPRVVYQLDIKSMKIESVDSDIISGNNTNAVQQIVGFSRSLVQEVLNERTAYGITMLLAEGSRMKNAQIFINDRTLEIGTDFEFAF